MKKGQTRRHKTYGLKRKKKDKKRLLAKIAQIEQKDEACLPLLAECVGQVPACPDQNPDWKTAFRKMKERNKF